MLPPRWVSRGRAHRSGSTTAVNTENWACKIAQSAPHHQLTTTSPDTVAKIGRLGEMKIEADNNAYLNELLVFDSSNIDEFAAKF